MHRLQQSSRSAAVGHSKGSLHPHATPASDDLAREGASERERERDLRHLRDRSRLRDPKRTISLSVNRNCSTSAAQTSRLLQPTSLAQHDKRSACCEASPPPTTRCSPAERLAHAPVAIQAIPSRAPELSSGLMLGIFGALIQRQRRDIFQASSSHTVFGAEYGIGNFLTCPVAKHTLQACESPDQLHNTDPTI